ncbi:hypothetical protein [Nostoc sp. MG11]|uniref:hypothetical protein n=1 Tax=Nostoc sp. MG11 TaxID=2721166 RepID=UPI0018662914|nr:hypothetical protein [Nostoc sp. MG11]
MLNNLLVARRQVLMIAILTGRFSDRAMSVPHILPTQILSVPVHPLRLDSKLKPKLVRNAITKAFDHALKR